jgi:hypothetical protein
MRQGLCEAGLGFKAQPCQAGFKVGSYEVWNENNSCGSGCRMVAVPVPNRLWLAGGFQKAARLCLMLVLLECACTCRALNQQACASQFRIGYRQSKAKVSSCSSRPSNSVIRLGGGRLLCVHACVCQELCACVQCLLLWVALLLQMLHVVAAAFAASSSTAATDRH